MPEKLRTSADAFDTSRKIQALKKSLEDRDSIAKFREVCEYQAEKYSEKMVEIRYSSPARSGPAR